MSTDDQAPGFGWRDLALKERHQRKQCPCGERSVKGSLCLHRAVDAPIPKPAMRRAAMNMPMLEAPACSAPPSTASAEARESDFLRPSESVAWEDKTDPIKQPAM